MAGSGESGPSASGRLSIGATRTKPVPAPGASAVEAAWNALGCVYDPELCMDVVSLGLVYEVAETGSGLSIAMTLTTPGCPAAEALPEMARIAVEDAVGPETPVDLRVVWDPPWSPTMIDDEAAGALGFRR